MSVKQLRITTDSKLLIRVNNNRCGQWALAVLGAKLEQQVELLFNKSEPQLKFEIRKPQTATLANAAVTCRLHKTFGTTPTSE